MITSCPACDMMWRKVYPEWAKKLGIEYGITAKHYSEVLAEKIEAGEFTFPGEDGRQEQKVTWHDSCHIGRACGVYEPPRELIKAIPGVEFVEMEHNREKALCCGSVLTLHQGAAGGARDRRRCGWRRPWRSAPRSARALPVLPVPAARERADEGKDIVESRTWPTSRRRRWATSCPTPTPRCERSGRCSRR